MQFVEANGARIPTLGMGTMTLKGETCVNAVSAALKLGYRHLDTAERYGNEAEVGEGLRASGIDRKDVFVTTKVYWDKLAPADFQQIVRREPAEAQAAVGRSPADPLAEQDGAAGRHHAGAVRGEAGRPRPAHRRRQLHRCR